MDKKNTRMIVIVLVVALLALFYVFFRGATIPQEPTSVTPPVNDIAVPALITAKHAYRNGEHLLAGEINLPTPCHLLEHTVTILPDGSRATIAFVRSFKGGECPGGEVPARFFVHFPAGTTTALRTTVDGKDVPLSLIEAAPNEDLEHTEIFLKG